MQRKSQRRSQRRWTVIVAFLAIATAATAELQLHAATSLGDPARAARALGVPRPTIPAGQGFTPDGLAGSVKRAADASTWPPAVRRALDGAFTDTLPTAMSTTTGCRHAPTLDPGDIRTCQWGPTAAAHHAVLIGDSIAASWSAGVAAALEPLGWHVEALAFSGCSPATLDATPTNEPDFAERCRASRAKMFDLVAASTPDLVILADGDNLLPYLDSGAAGPAAEREWAAGTLATIRELSTSAGRVVYLPGPPPGPVPSTCATRFTGPARCATTATPEFEATRRAEAAAASTARASGIDAELIDTRSWFCSGSVCPAFVGAELVRIDRSHLSEGMSTALGAVIRRSLHLSSAP